MSLPLPKKGSGLNTIAIDFDGTLAEPTWPSPRLGRALRKGKEAAIAYRDLGYEVVIWTSRPQSHQAAIIAWMQDEGLGDVIYDVICDKPRYALFVDDRAVTFPEAFADECVVPTPKVVPTPNVPSARCKDGQGGPCYHMDLFCRQQCKHDSSCAWTRGPIEAWSPSKPVCNLPNCTACP